MRCLCPIHGIIYKTYTSVQQGKGCKECSFDKRRVDFNQVIKEFSERGFIVLDNAYSNSNTPIKCKCKKHLHMPELYISRENLISGKHGCKYCWQENRIGSNSPRWDGGKKPLIDYLRASHITQWKKDSMKESNYKCVITGERFDDIHHLYSMHNIVSKVMEELGLKEINHISQYTNEELREIIDKCQEIHQRYPLGVCLTREVHELFHEEYGYMNNIPEQFEEFKQRYNKGEFDHLLEKEVVSL